MTFRIPTSPADVDEQALQRLAAIIEHSNDAIISKDLDGVITSWNPAASRLFGYSAEEIIGKSILKLIPEYRRGEEPIILDRIRNGEKVDTYDTERLHKDGRLISVHLSVSPILDFNGVVIGASKILREAVVDQAQENRLAAQNRVLEQLDQISQVISKELDLERAVQVITDIATKAACAEFGAFFYNLEDERGESYTLYSLSGAARSDFERFGMPRNTAVFRPTFKGEGVVRSGDIRKDARYGKSAPHHGMPSGHLPVVSYLALPVIGRSGNVLGGLLFGHSKPDIFGEEAEMLVSRIAVHAAIAVENAHLHRAAQDENARRRQAEENSALLFQELQHRVKNSLATIQGIASQTLRKTPPDELAAFAGRVQALAGAHDLLLSRTWATADLRDVIARALAPFQNSVQRLSYDGPALAVTATDAVTLAMIFHELSTNALKYGALSKPGGSVSVNWLHTPDGIDLTWREEGGPTVSAPSRSGFGSKLVSRSLSGRGEVNLDYRPDGLVARLLLKTLQPQNASDS